MHGTMMSALGAVSIRAPVKDATGTKPIKLADILVSIRAPVKDATYLYAVKSKH